MNVKQTLLKLASYNIKLRKLGGPEKNGLLFEKMMKMEDELLDTFGLPLNADYVELIRFSSIPSEEELHQMIALLNELAQDYLLGEVKTSHEILTQAQENEEDAIFVLPELKVQLSLYTLFVYDEILMKQKDSIDHVWDEFKLCKDEKIRSLIANLSDPNTDEVALLSIMLEANGLRYVKQFINEKKNVLCLN
ncbi:MAG: hypothetical protein ACK46R_11370 [Bacteroidota bacterium]